MEVTATDKEMEILMDELLIVYQRYARFLVNSTYHTLIHTHATSTVACLMGDRLTPFAAILGIVRNLFLVEVLDEPSVRSIHLRDVRC